MLVLTERANYTALSFSLSVRPINAKLTLPGYVLCTYLSVYGPVHRRSLNIRYMLFRMNIYFNAHLCEIGNLAVRLALK